MKNTKMLKKNYEFRNVLSKGKYYSGRYIEAFINRNNKENNCLGIAIGVKIAKAVKRNKIKRLIRASYNKNELKIKYGYNIIFLWKKKADTQNANFENINNDIIKIFDKANIFIEDNKWKIY